MDQGSRGGLDRAGPRRRHHGHAQARRHETAHGRQVGPFEHHVRHEPGRFTQVVGEPPQRRRGSQRDERLTGHVGQPDPAPSRQPVVARHGQPQRLQRQLTGQQRRVMGAAGAELQVGLPAGQRRRVQLVPDLGQLEPDLRVRGPEAVHQVRHQPGAQRVLEGQRHRPGLRLEQLVDRRDPVVQLVQQGVHVALEHRPGLGHAQDAARALQQRGADLGLQPGQRPGHAGLGHALQLAHLGDRRTVGDLLKPAQRIGIHNHDGSSWINSLLVIGRMDDCR